MGRLVIDAELRKPLLLQDLVLGGEPLALR
jgi:hypothetical protein